MRSASTPPAAGNGLEPGFRGVICVSFGSTGDTAVPDTDGQPRHDLHFEAATANSLLELKSVFSSSRVGVRLVLAGPSTDIRAAAAVAADCGLLGEEVTLLSQETGPRFVYCPHCLSTTVDGAAGTEVACQGCATVLAVTDHFSRRRGAYLGYSAHAEEAA
jgi:dimethylamine monooxygenase subunit C